MFSNNYLSVILTPKSGCHFEIIGRCARLGLESALNYWAEVGMRFKPTSVTGVDCFPVPIYVQVLELMQMHPKERLGRGYFDNQLV